MLCMNHPCLCMFCYFNSQCTRTHMLYTYTYAVHMHICCTHAHILYNAHILYTYTYAVHTHICCTHTHTVHTSTVACSRHTHFLLVADTPTVVCSRHTHFLLVPDTPTSCLFPDTPTCCLFPDTPSYNNHFHLNAFLTYFCITPSFSLAPDTTRLKRATSA